MKLCVLFLMSVIPFGALANMNCEGVIPIPTWNEDRDVGMDFDRLEAGERMGLWAPITEDKNTYIVLKIVSADANAQGDVLVKAQYLLEEISNLSFVYKKDAQGQVQLVDFKGIEGGIEFGPGHLVCADN